IAGFRLQLDFLNRPELGFAQNLATGWAWLENEEFSVLGANVELAVGEHRRRALQRAEGLLPELLAGVDVKREQVRAVVDQVEAVGVMGPVQGTHAGALLMTYDTHCAAAA